MENQGDYEGEIHPGSSSSSSSPPSSHSSSSSSSSSPSHPQSFASSRSSQKELSAPSSSHSSSSSSSPFSGPSSPAHVPVDEASPSASQESHTTAVPSFSVEGCHTDKDIASSSNKEYPLDVSKVIEQLEVKNGENNNGNGEPRLEPPSLIRHAESGNDACDTVLEEFNSESYNGQTLDTIFNMNTSETLKATQALVACNDSMSTPEVIQLAANSNSSNSGCKQSLPQAPNEVDGCAGSSRQQDTNLKDGSRQIDTITSRNSAPSETRIDLIGLHDDVCASRDCDRPTTVCNENQLSQANNSSIHRLEPEASHNLSTMDQRETSAEAAALSSNMSSTSLVEDKPTHESKTMRKSSKHLQDGSFDINKLPRAKTMPSGSLEVVNGEVRPSRPSTFKRSSTDKSKAGGPPRASGPKLSKRKQKKLMKKMCTLQKDGTVELDLARSARFAPDMFESEDWEDYYGTTEGEEDTKAIPPLQIAMLIVGTRGDVQPFVAIGKRLQGHGHRVRLATHSNFQEFVLKAGLEFYPLGGDPKVLAGYMVKNKGFLPSGPSEIRTQKKQLKSIINSLLPACTRPYGPGVPFKAQAIIANPPAYGHVHVAEALKVPLHIFFTMPWTVNYVNQNKALEFKQGTKIPKFQDVKGTVTNLPISSTYRDSMSKMRSSVCHGLQHRNFNVLGLCATLNSRYAAGLQNFGWSMESLHCKWNPQGFAILKAVSRAVAAVQHPARGGRSR
ncbi:hypothetical protein L7F22_015538 [Adiantum nelumboides]|nr:hypothetical protein [Adiantum nelumboides]